MRVNNILEYFKDNNLFLVANSLSERVKPLCSCYQEIKVASDENLAKLVLEFKPDLVIVDHYFLDASFESQLYPYTKVAVIDDLANRTHCAHVLFDQTASRSNSEYQKLVNQDCKLYLGSNYNYIKSSFNEVKKVEASTDKKRVLINFGGSDPVHGCFICANTILQEDLYQKYDFTILSGLSNPDHQKLELLLKDYPQIKLLSHTNDVPLLFSHTDLAIGACGGMFKERIIAKIPSINVEIADNQKGTDAFIKESQIGLCLRVEDLYSVKKISDALTDLCQNFKIYQNNCSNLFKADGILNVVKVLENLLK